MDKHSTAQQANQVGHKFAEAYYTKLHDDPKELFKFYKETSTLTLGNFMPVPDSIVSTQHTYNGLEEIRSYFASAEFVNARTELYSLDSQYTTNDSVMVLVNGTLICEGKPRRSFMQCFLLAATEPRRYFIANDIFRYLPEPHVLSYVGPAKGASAEESVPAPAYTANAIGQEPVEEQTIKVPAATAAVAEATFEEAKKEVPVVEKPAPVKEPAAVEPAPAAPSVPLTYAERLKLGAAKQAAAAAANATTAAPAAKPVAVPAATKAAPSVPRATEQHSGAQDRLSAPGIVAKDLPPGVDEAKVREKFQAYGALKAVTVKHAKGKSSYAFVDFVDASAVPVALAAKVEIDGRPVVIDEKRPRAAGPSAGRGGRGRGPAPSGRGAPGGARGYARGENDHGRYNGAFPKEGGEQGGFKREGGYAMGNGGPVGPRGGRGPRAPGRGQSDSRPAAAQAATAGATS